MTGLYSLQVNIFTITHMDSATKVSKEGKTGLLLEDNSRSSEKEPRHKAKVKNENKTEEIDQTNHRNVKDSC